MLQLHDKAMLLELLQQGAIAITPNNRLSSIIINDYFSYCTQNTVIKPACLPYTHVLTKLVQKQQLEQCDQTNLQLLNDFQCRYLWQGIIKDTNAVTFSEGLLQAAIDAWQRCEQWQIKPEHDAFTYTPQTRLFQTWWQKFNKQLQALNAISCHQIIPYLLKASPKNLFSTPIIWVCFDEFTPQQIELQTYLLGLGIDQYHYDLSPVAATPTLCAAENNEAEYEQLVLWIQRSLQQGMTTIGVVVPELQQTHRRIHRLLTHHFNSEQFNISLGEQLNNYPLVAHALNWLQLDHEGTPDNDLLFQSPYIAAAQEEFVARAQLVQDQPQNVSIKSLSDSIANRAPKLAALLNDLSHYPIQASPQDWVELFQNRLNKLGFPGDVGLNSAQYQCYQRFITLFDEFRQLALVATSFTKQEALDTLTQLAKNTIFQIQKNKAAIQVLGLLEASGGEFDNLWIMGLSDHCLPAKPQLSAFIPKALQHDLHMPHHSAARELQFAQSALARLQNGSPTTVFSYAKLQGDSPNLPCSLIADFPLYQQVLSSKKHTTTALVVLPEPYEVPLTNHEFITGGTALLGNQAKCPFKAFAEHRLAAKPPPTEIEGTDYKERGTIIHKVMELLWQKIQSQAKLLMLAEDQLDQWINEAIEQAHQQEKRSHQEATALVQHIERQRLTRLVHDCLKWEKQRPAFSIQALEQSYSINLNGLDIKVRIDRLDNVEGDKSWVIDYKSSIPSNKPWNEERPQEPQLILYSLLNEQINTLLFLQMKTGAIICSGFSEEKIALKGISSLKKDETWIETRNYWKQQLTTLAAEIRSGYCPPTPINNTICAYCDFKNLCRI